MFCSYRNTTDRMVVVRVRGISEFFLERVVFPFEIMTFHCPRDCEAEVIMRTPNGGEQSECIAAEHLVAGEHVASSQDTWRPARNIRSLSVRSNASAICRDFP
jgi:hypothetical protein